MDITVTTRPVRPTDRTLFYRFWERLSPETVYRRFHGPVHSLPDESVRRLLGNRREPPCPASSPLSTAAAPPAPTSARSGPSPAQWPRRPPSSRRTRSRPS